jgi:hypothetical protein
MRMVVLEPGRFTERKQQLKPESVRCVAGLAKFSFSGLDAERLRFRLLQRTDPSTQIQL